MAFTAEPKMTKAIEGLGGQAIAWWVLLSLIRLGPLVTALRWLEQRLVAVAPL